MTLSTYLGYQLYANNLQQSLQRTANESSVQQAATYYNANIGKVKTVSDLVNNYRLLSYATQAFGLSNMTYAKALLTQVLTSNLSDSSSVANKLGGAYVAFAKAFSFNTDGTIKTTADLQTTAQQSSTEALFNAKTTLSSTDAATATTNYETAMKSITSLSQLEANSTALSYVMTAYGLDDTSTGTATFEKTLESALSSSTSYLNTQTDNGYEALNRAFNVTSTGDASSATAAQTDANIQATTSAYMAAAGTSSSAQSAAATETQYYLSKIGSITSVSDLTSDSRLLAYVVKAYNLPATATADTVTAALESDTSSGTSFANTSPYSGYLALAKAFNFTTSGAAGTVTQFQSESQQQQTVSLYTQRQTSDDATDQAATAYYEANIGSVTSVSQLESNTQLLDYVMKAYGIDPSTPTTTLTSILEDTSNVATTTANGSLLQLKLDFNTDASGNATNPLTAQSSANISATTSAYTSAAGTDAASQAAATNATTYYKNAIANVTSVSDLLSDPKLVSYIEQAYSIPTTTTTGVLRQVLTSDLSNSASTANKMGTNYAQLAAAFDFNTSGLLGTETQGAQSKAQLEAANSDYVQQQMETEASAQSTGAGLALYLQANASKISSAYDILADSKLTTIFQVLMNLPSTASNGDIDSQAKAITNQFNLADLKNPTKLQNLIQRFSVLYDMNPPTSTTTNYTTTSLFSGSTNTLDVTSLFGASSSSSSLTTASLFSGTSSSS